MQEFAAWSIVEYDGVDTSGMNGEGAVVQSPHASGTGFALSVPLGTFGDPTHNWAVGALGLATGTQVTGGQGFSAIDQEIVIQGTLQTQDKTGQAQGTGWNWSGAAAAAGAIALEVKSEVALSALELAQRFEPILYFHREETFFPSDAKRYVERCALWRAEPPLDLKDCWGGKGGPFPRSPVIPSGLISGVAGESGTFLASNPAFLNVAGERRFFDLAGWKDKGGIPQPSVTQTSQNSYVDRGAIANRYSTDPLLRDSQFWYHVELFDTAQLKALLAETESELNLVAIITAIEAKKPALLCYYFFYPAHEESLAAVCTNIEAKEFGCFSGE